MLEEVPDKEISITEKGGPVLTYCYDDSVSCSYFHPICATNGQVVTEGMIETEQKHLPGLCFSFGTVKNENGEPIELRRSGRTLNRETFKSSGSQELAKFVSETTWQVSNSVLIETISTTVHPHQPDVRILGLTVVLHASSTLITFEGEIGLGYNAVEMEHRKAANANGKIGESEVNEQESEWATLCGIAGDAAVGVAILPHPENRQTLFLAEDAYQGFLLAQTAPFTLNSSEKRKLNYRILIYLGDLFTFDVADYYQKYIDG